MTQGVDDAGPAVGAAQPRMRVFAGPNGSGKSTIHEHLRPEWIGVYVNADDIERQLRQTGALDLRPFDLQCSPAELQSRLREHLAQSVLLRKNGLQRVSESLVIDASGVLQLPLASINSYVAAVLADALRRLLLEQGVTFTFETVMSSPDKIEFMRQAQARGYRTYLYFVATDDPAINLARVAQRVAQGGHDVPEDKVRERYRRSIDLLDAACAASNRAYVFDNSGEAHELLAEIVDGDELHVHADALPAWFTTTSLWRSFQTAGPSATPDT